MRRLEAIIRRDDDAVTSRDEDIVIKDYERRRQDGKYHVKIHVSKKNKDHVNQHRSGRETAAATVGG